MSVDNQLLARLEAVASRQRRLRLWCQLATGWAATGLAGLGLLALERQIGWASVLALPLVAIAGVVTAVVMLLRHWRTILDWRSLALGIELSHPDLDGRLLTAVQQQPESSGELHYLQRRVVEEALQHHRQKDWAAAIPLSRIRLAQAAHWLALLLVGVVLWELRVTGGRSVLARISDFVVSVTPGDISLERGGSLVVLARFSGTLPASVDLVLGAAGDNLRRIPLAKSLADPIFGGSVPEVASNLVYHIEYAGQRTRDFKATVFEYPRLERADVDLAFPAYTDQPPKHIPDTRRLSAVEGALLDLALQLNKPVAAARLVPRDKSKPAVQLLAETNRPAASLSQFPLEASAAYDLQLVDTEGRANKVPASFVFDVLKNRPPELKLASPRGDVRPSPLEEISFEGTVWDDFGVKAYGLAYTVAGKDTQLIELGKAIPAKEKRTFAHVLRLEDLGVQPDDLLAWFVWAEDIGPDGQLRRTSGDLFFAEVRPFDEIFREGQSMDGESQQQQQQQRQSRSARLTELQKQIINATWRLQRDRPAPPAQPKPPALRESKFTPAPDREPTAAAVPAESAGHEHVVVRIKDLRYAKLAAQIAPADSEQPLPRRPATRAAPAAAKKPAVTYEEDAAVVRDSQASALEQIQAALARQDDPRIAALLRSAAKEMEKALAKLEQATNSPAPLPDALAAEQAAYQALLKLQQHEYEVQRNRNRSGSQSGNSREQQMQLQLEQMDLTQTENRYETQRQAQRPQDPARGEQLQVMNRLQELARRQQDLNDRLKELQTALQEARTEAEREEIRRRLKRLQESEQQMLADLDELRQRMDRPENQSRMAEQRRQLDQTREDVQRASEASGQANPSQALASGTRAQRQLQELRDQMRKENSSQFADELRDMRAQARELANRQEDIQKKMDTDAASDRKSLSDSADRKEVTDQLAQQTARMTNLLDRATQVSQQAEGPEPLLSRQLYDTVRQFSQDTAKNVQELQNDLLEHGLLTRSQYDRLKDPAQPDGAKLLDLTSDLWQQNFNRQASEAGQRARSNLDQLKRGVERAAESVLGDDTEALRLAQQELDQLTEQLQREMAQGQGRSSQTNRQLAQASGGAPRDGESNRQPGNGQRGQPQEANPRPDATDPSPTPDQQSAERAEVQGNPSDRNGQSQPAQRQAGARGQRQRPGNPNEPGDRQAGQAGQDAQDQQNTSRPEAQADRVARAGGDRRGGDQESTNANGESRTVSNDPLSEFERYLEGRGGTAGGGPITGRDFTTWSDRLRNVEEMVDLPDLRVGVGTARERARVLRQEFKREGKSPDWAVVRLQVMKPLVEVRDRIADELARRQSADALVPIDRDPVPTRYSDLVRRYYEELGKDRPPQR